MNVVEKMRSITLLGIKVKINLLLIPILALSILGGYYKELLITFLLVFIHEMSHCRVAQYYQIPIQEIELFPFGGVVKTEENLGAEPLKEILIALAGPLSNFIMLAIGYFLMAILPLEGDLINIFLLANLIMGAFNLLPILPLDGGRVLRGVISYHWGIKRATNITIIIGKTCTILLLFKGLILTLEAIENLYLLLLPIFLYVSLHQERKMVIFLYFKDVLRKKSKLEERGIMNSRYLTVMDNVNLNKVLHEFCSGKYHFVSVINKEGRFIGTLTETEVLEALGRHGNHMTIGTLINITKNQEESQQ
ncbi:site-2 protease family protein [Alkaliphilus crotonatoxidans]